MTPNKMRVATERLNDFIQRRRIQAGVSTHGLKPQHAAAHRILHEQLTRFLAEGVMNESTAKPPPVQFDTNALGFTHARVDAVVTTPEELFELVMLVASDLTPVPNRPMIFNHKD